MLSNEYSSRPRHAAGKNVPPRSNKAQVVLRMTAPRSRFTFTHCAKGTTTRSCSLSDVPNNTIVGTPPPPPWTEEEMAYYTFQPVENNGKLRTVRATVT